MMGRDDLGRRGAFTLIELLVVISIIAVLAAILFPVFARAKAAAKTSATLSNLRQLGTALELYMGDADDVYPQSTDGMPGQALAGGWVYYSEFGGAGAGAFDVAKGSLIPYIKSKEVFKSPNDSGSLTSGNAFGFNGHLADWTGLGLNPGKSSAFVENPSSTMLLGEEGCWGGGDGYPYTKSTNDGYFNPGTDHFGKFHAAGTAILFCDTHAKILPAEDRFISTICGSDVPCF